MKKTLLLVAAAVALVACSNEETVRQSAPEAIGFDNAFVENSTRSVETPGYSTTSMFTDFAVYGFVEGASLFDGVKVANEGITNAELKSDWKYEGTQYWIAGANYDFYAVAPYNGGWSVKTGTTPTDAGATLSFTTADGTQDLLYASIVERQGAGEDNTEVGFTFKHILSKVKFSFVNHYNASAATIRVKNVKVTNAYTTGDVALAADNAETTDVDESVAWSNQANTGTFSFGNAAVASATAEEAYACDTTQESYYERLLIPANAELNITFDVELLVSGEVIDTYTHTAKITIDLQPGMSYDINAEITAANIDPEHAQEPIEFTATMTDWSNANEVDATVVTQ